VAALIGRLQSCREVIDGIVAQAAERRAALCTAQALEEAHV
jgi:hypothetical protein